MPDSDETVLIFQGPVHMDRTLYAWAFAEKICSQSNIQAARRSEEKIFSFLQTDANTIYNGGKKSWD